MRVSSLTLSHFRSHKSARLALDGRPVVLFGHNGAGKTNVIEAVSLLSPGRGLRRGAVDEFIRQPEALGWKLRADLHSLAHQHEIETWAEPGGARQVRIDGKGATQTALARINRVLWLVPAMDRLWIEGADARRRFLDRIALSFAPQHADATLTYDKAMRERNRLLKDQVDTGAWYDALEDQMAQSGAAIQANRNAALQRMATVQQEAVTSFPKVDLQLVPPDGQEVMPEGVEPLRAALAASRPRDRMAGRTLVGPHRVDLHATYVAKGVAARQCSTGEQKALLVSVVLNNARALKQDFGAPPLLLLDEVAAHLDADRRAALYDEISALGAQAWMTGTGAELFTALADRAQYFEVCDVGTGSTIDEKGTP